VFSVSIARLSSVKTQLIYFQLKWRQVSTQGVIIRPIIEPCLRYIKWKCTFLGSKMFTTVVPLLDPRSLIAVNILGSQECALSLDVPQTWCNNWPDDDSLSRNISPL